MVPNTFHLNSPRFIKSQGELQQAAKILKSEKRLAVDTEANSLYAYQEQVCLIQISTPGDDFVIDTLALDDLSILASIFQDPAIEKIFHASEYDILIMHDQFDFEFKNLFDTMLAAQILGRKKLGLNALLEEYVGIKVNKKYQRANWGKRPLTPDMLKYAQVDTHYLFLIRDKLDRELNKKGMTRIADEDFKRSCLVYKQTREDKIAPCWRIQGSKKLSPQKAAVLQELCKYRDDAARKMNQPVFKVIGAQSLLRLAETCPTSVQQIDKLGLPGKNLVKRHGVGLLEAVKKGLSASPAYPPRRKRVDESFLLREKALRDWRKRTANLMHVNSAVVLPRELLYSLVTANPKTVAEMTDLMKEVPWRLERFGDDILSILLKAN